MRFVITLPEDVACFQCEEWIFAGMDVHTNNEDGEGEFFCSPRCFDRAGEPDPDEAWDRRHEG